MLDRYRLSVEGIEVSAVLVVLTSWYFVSIAIYTDCRLYIYIHCMVCDLADHTNCRYLTCVSCTTLTYAVDSAKGQIVIPLVSPVESSYDKKIKEVSIFVVLIPTVGTIAGTLT
jgi:hypothetical protein